jgi:ParB-like chromosome segregation protein Spo0J
MAGKRRSRGVREVPPPGAVTWRGNEQIRAALVPIDALSEDPENARTHDERSIATIAASLEEFGQQRPVLCDAGRVVRAGNGQLLAARRLGWTHLSAVRSDLEGARLLAYSLADNRTAELAGWDDTRLLEHLRAVQSDPSGGAAATGFSEAEIEGLADRIAQALLEATPPDGPPDPTPDFRPGDASEQGRLDEPGRAECPACGHTFVPDIRRR